MKKHTHKGFTLIELLMVIAIIGILAGILIPTVGAVRKQANIAASKAQLSSYISAFQMFKGEYSYYPFTGTVALEDEENFVAALSGKPSEAASAAGNRRRIAFHSFSESEFYVNSDGTVSETLLADRFSNPKIFLEVDGTSSGVVRPALAEDSALDAPEGGDLRAEITGWVEPNTDAVHGDQPGYTLWD